VQRCKVRTRNAPGVCDTYRKENNAMAKVVKVTELMSQSPKSWEDAAQGAVTGDENPAEYPLDLRQGIYC
jgi:hypothetical protein